MNRSTYQNLLRSPDAPTDTAGTGATDPNAPANETPAAKKKRVAFKGLKLNHAPEETVAKREEVAMLSFPTKTTWEQFPKVVAAYIKQVNENKLAPTHVQGTLYVQKVVQPAS